MQAHSLVLALIAALFLIFGAFAAACGDGGGSGGALTLEEYFQQLEALTATAEERSAEFEAAANAELDAATSEEDVFAAIEDALTNAQPIFTTFADGLNDLNPPAAVEELHNEFVDASAEVLASLKEVFNEFDDLDSVTDPFELLDELGLSQAADRFDKTCAALQDIADENEIDVNLVCE